MRLKRAHTYIHVYIHVYTIVHNCITAKENFILPHIHTHHQKKKRRKITPHIEISIHIFGHRAVVAISNYTATETAHNTV